MSTSSKNLASMLSTALAMSDRLKAAAEVTHAEPIAAALELTQRSHDPAILDAQRRRDEALESWKTAEAAGNIVGDKPMIRSAVEVAANPSNLPTGPSAVELAAAAYRAADSELASAWKDYHHAHDKWLTARQPVQVLEYIGQHLSHLTNVASGDSDGRWGEQTRAAMRYAEGVVDKARDAHPGIAAAVTKVGACRPELSRCQRRLETADAEHRQAQRALDRGSCTDARDYLDTCKQKLKAATEEKAQAETSLDQAIAALELAIEPIRAELDLYAQIEAIDSEVKLCDEAFKAAQLAAESADSSSERYTSASNSGGCTCDWNYNCPSCSSRQNASRMGSDRVSGMCD